MKWTWDKTDAVVGCGLLSALLASAMSAVFSCCCCVKLFLILWGLSAGAYVISAALEISPKGRCVLVTGCDSGFGLALALHLNKLGFKVFAGCLLADQGGEGAKQLKLVSSGQIHVLQLDVTSEQQVTAAVKEVKKLMAEGEVLWGIVNNAGYSTFGDMEWMPRDTFFRTLQVNTLGVFSVTKAFLPLIRRAKGRVVTISSGLARMAAPMRSAYVTSKYAVEGLCDCLRYEMRDWGVKVSLIEPGNFIAGTGIFSERGIEATGESMWKAMDEGVKMDYGKHRFEARVSLMKEYGKGGDTDLTPVLTAFTEGLVQQYPQVRYTPMNLYFRTRVFVATHLPEWFYERFYV